MRCWKKLAAVAAVACVLVSLPSAGRAEDPRYDCGNLAGYQAGAPWPAFQRCSTRLGISRVRGARTNALNWSANVGGIVRSPVVAADGTIYVGAGTRLYAISSTGSVLWNSNIWGNIAAAPAIAADGTIYVVSAAGALAAVNPSNGSHKWVYRGAWGIAINTSPLIAGDGTVYFVDTSNNVHAVRANGTVKWVRLFPGPIFSSLTLSRDERTLYIGSAFLGLRAARTSDGAIVWINPLHMGEYSAPTIGADGTIYVGSGHGELFALSPLDGRLKWVATHRLLLLDYWRDIKVSPSMAPDGDIIFGTETGMLVKLSPAGAIRWEKQLNAGVITGSPAVDADGVIYVGTEQKKLFALNPDGTTLWSRTLGSAIWSAPAIGAQGTIYVGANDGRLYSVGIGTPDAFAEPFPPVQPATPIHIPTGGTPPGPDGEEERLYCDHPSLPTVSALRAAAPPGQKPKGIVTPRPGLASSYNSATGTFSINGLTGVGTGDNGTSQCSARLCSWGAQDGAGGAQLSASEEALLLRDDVRPTCGLFEPNCTVLPANLFVPCEAVVRSPSECYARDYTAVRYDLPQCTGDSSCPSNHACTLVCPQGAPGMPSQCDLAEPGEPLPDGTPTTDDPRENRCVPLVQSSNCIDGLAPDDNCYTVTECPRPEDVVTSADALPMCIDRNGAQVRCEDLDQSAAILDPAEGQVPQPHAAAFPTGDAQLMDDPGTEIATICKVVQPDNALNRSDDGGSPAKPAQRKDWGIETSAGFETKFGTKPGPFGLSLPDASARANFDILGRVMGRDIRVFSLGGSALATLFPQQKVESEAHAVLFGQDIAQIKAGAALDDRDNTSIIPTADVRMRDLTQELEKVGAEAKARLAQVTRIYNRAVQAPVGSDLEGVLTSATRTITRDMCKKALREATYLAESIVGPRADALNAAHPELFEVVGGVLNYKRADPSDPLIPVQVDPICDAPLTKETAKLVMDKIVSNYETAVDGIGQQMSDIFASGAAGPYHDKSPWASVQQSITTHTTFQEDTQGGDGYRSAAYVAGLRQEFSIIGASAVFPIGPLALVLEIQGSGFWGISGQIEYGYAFDLAQAFTDNGVPARVFASALVAPEAGVKVDAYVGIGFDIGIAGASVGINGEITLVHLTVPVGGEIQLGVATKPAQPTTLRTWPAELATLSGVKAVKLPLRTYGVNLTSTLKAGINFRALQGTISVAARVKLLFFKKTWRKKIATLAGYSKTFNWVGRYDASGNFTTLALPAPDFSVLPAFPFPDISPLNAADFGALLDQLDNGAVVPSNPDLAGLENFMRANADYFKNGWLPNSNLDPWSARGEYPSGPDAATVKAALDLAVASAKLDQLPPECSLTPNGIPDIQ